VLVLDQRRSDYGQLVHVCVSGERGLHASSRTCFWVVAFVGVVAFEVVLCDCFSIVSCVTWLACWPMLEHCSGSSVACTASADNLPTKQADGHHHHHHHHHERPSTTAAKRFGIKNFVYCRRRPFHPQRCGMPKIDLVPPAACQHTNKGSKEHTLQPLTCHHLSFQS
jgi:hypothetical protein